MSVQIVEHAAGLSWVIDEAMRRASHALGDGERVWLVDPVDEPEALERALALGSAAAVIQLLDRHNRACEQIARRLGIPHERLPSTLPGTPFEVLPVISFSRWRERALLWRERDALVVAEALGTAPGFALRSRPLGVHPMLRLTPPRQAFADLHPRLLLVGHGAPLQHDADGALAQALSDSRREIPRLLLDLPGLLRG